MRVVVCAKNVLACIADIESNLCVAPQEPTKIMTVLTFLEPIARIDAPSALTWKSLSFESCLIRRCGFDDIVAVPDVVIPNSTLSVVIPTLNHSLLFGWIMYDVLPLCGRERRKRFGKTACRTVCV